MLCRVCRDDRPMNEFSTETVNSCIVSCGVGKCMRCASLPREKQKRLTRESLENWKSKGIVGDAKAQRKAWLDMTKTEKRAAQIENRTPSEIRLGEALTRRGIEHAYQVPVGPYFLDYQILPQRLAIEVDGSIHNLPEQKEHDRKRNNFLVKSGWKVIRFTNKQINDDVDSVLDSIIEAVTDKVAMKATPKEVSRATSVPAIKLARKHAMIQKIRVIPPHELVKMRTPDGGWTKSTLKKWGIDWPPVSGWKKELEQQYRNATERREGIPCA